MRLGGDENAQNILVVAQSAIGRRRSVQQEIEQRMETKSE